MPSIDNIPKAISRRQFIAFTALYGISSAVTASLHSATTLFNQAQDSLAFADLVGLGPELEALVLEKLFTPLHPGKSLTRDDTQVDAETAQKLLVKLLHNEGIPWRDSYRVGVSFQHFGVAQSFNSSHRLLNYCRGAQEFIYSKLDTLDLAPLNWRILDSGSIPSDGSKITAVVGRFTYYMLKVYAIGLEHEHAPTLISAKPVDRAIHYIENNSTHKPNKGIIYIIPGNTSLISPFSETLYLLMHTASQQYENQLQQQMSPLLAERHARLVTQTVNKAGALLLAMQYLANLDEERRAVTIQTMIHSLSHQYSLLPHTLHYMRTKGVQASIDLFRSNPSKLMANILRV